MLKFQMGLIALLIGCVAFISCDQLAGLLTPAPPEEDTTADSIVNMMGLPMYISMYTSWMSKELPAPGPLADAASPAETGEVHGAGTRTVYINGVGAMALEAESITAYPAGTIIVKAIMDDANTFVQKVATMKKTDDARHNGWTYKKYARPDENADYMQVRGDGLEDAAVGCHGCHAKADTDSVFVDFSVDSEATEPTDGAMPDDGTMPDDDTMPDNGTTPDDGMTMPDDTMPTDGTLPVTVDLAGYTSWMSNPLPGPILSGGAHGQNARTVYINDVGAMALQDTSVTAYPAGTVIVKDIMDDANTAIQSRAIMVKTDDLTYADHNGWIYKYVDINAESVEVGSDGLDGQQGCHGCHLGAAMDSVFAFPIAEEGEGQ